MIVIDIVVFDFFQQFTKTFNMACYLIEDNFLSTQLKINYDLNRVKKIFLNGNNTQFKF